MPLRAFTSQKLVDLQRTIATIEAAQLSGNIEELRVAGVLTRTGKVDVAQIYQQARYEAYLRCQDLLRADPAYVCGMPLSQQVGINQDTLLKLAQYPNPYRENIRRVETMNGCRVSQSILP